VPRKMQLFAVLRLVSAFVIEQNCPFAAIRLIA